MTTSTSRKSRNEFEEAKKAEVFAEVERQKTSMLTDYPF